MARHFVRMELKPAVMLQRPLALDVDVLQMGRPHVRVSTIREQGPKGGVLATGLQFDATLDADSWGQALARSTEVAEYLMTHLSFIAAAGLSGLRPRLVVDIDPRTQEHEFMQLLEPPYPIPSRRIVGPEKLMQHVQALESVPIGRRKEHIVRSMRLYQRALLAEDDLESFTLLWIALEALDLPLAHRLKGQGELAGLKGFFHGRAC